MNSQVEGAMDPASGIRSVMTAADAHLAANPDATKQELLAALPVIPQLYVLISKTRTSTLRAIRKISAANDGPVMVGLLTAGSISWKLANLPLIDKVSHTSKHITPDRMRGSVNYSNVMPEFAGIPNDDDHLAELWERIKDEDAALHLERICIETSRIRPRKVATSLTPAQRETVLRAPERSREFYECGGLAQAAQMIDRLVAKAAGATLTAAHAHPPGRTGSKSRGDAIERAITSSRPDQALEDLTLVIDTRAVPVSLKHSLASSRGSSPQICSGDKLLAHYRSAGAAPYLIATILIDLEANHLTVDVKDLLDRRVLTRLAPNAQLSGRARRPNIQANNIRAIAEDREGGDFVEDQDAAVGFLERLIDA